MSVSCIVIDSNVYAKTFLDEGDTASVTELFRFIAEQDWEIFCPNIFLYEVLSIAVQNGVSLQKTYQLLGKFQESYLYISPLTSEQFQLALRMAEDGNDKSGFPSIYDSAYHALALSCQGLFITADKRHVAKAGKFGNVVLLEYWEEALRSPQSQ